MGYYDDHDPSGEGSKRNRNHRGGWFWAGLVGAIFGVLVMLVATPVLAKYNILPYGNENAASQNEGQQTTPSGNAGQHTTGNKTMNVNVNTAASKAVKSSSKAVVGVINYQTADFKSPFGQAGSGSQKAQPEGQGSGVIYKKQDGHAYIATNYHVVKGATKLEVSFNKKKKVTAQLVGKDKWMDLAVIKINAKYAHNVAKLGNSKKLQVGEPVVAIGNALGLEGSVTQGIISSTNRTVPRDVNGDGKPDWQAEVLQTDAAINPGNSGGALINMDGQVIGINSMKIAQQAVEGIGFAIPINVAKPIINDLEKHGKVDRPHIGIYFQDLSRYPSDYRKKAFNLPSKVKAGVIVKSIDPGSAADHAGVEPGDVIVSMDGHKIKDVLTFRKRLYNKHQPGDKLKIGYYRDGKKKTATMKLGRENG